MSETIKAADFDPKGYGVEEVLRDGSKIRIRAIRPDDRERLREHSRALSAQSVYNRFMFYKRELSDDDLRRFTELDFEQHVGIVAILSENGRDSIIGVGRYIRTSHQRAEIAFSVPDKYQGHGIGTLLLAHLSRIAQNCGIIEFEADVMGDNVHMLDVIATSGFQMQTTHDSGVVHVLLRIGPAASE